MESQEACVAASFNDELLAGTSRLDSQEALRGPGGFAGWLERQTVAKTRVKWVFEGWKAGEQKMKLSLNFIEFPDLDAC